MFTNTTTANTQTRVFVIVNRCTGFIYGVTQNIDRARDVLTRAQAEAPADVISISDEPILK